ncbi:MAG: hypothetical protein GEV28_07140 [Actinophytocola sp.]|uniref:hypothetical protein n=1 Tax=Actinophytocola sp. TaxID=1872138 RepID=UPI001328D370|nr:hypothetical protein [Actinophytocola sp.]MPZ80168.1 hypothetical protein [Actinophytocola sp.]
MPDHATLTDELKRLRKGRGVHSTNIADRVGPALRRLCGIGPDDPSATVRDRLGMRLRDLAARLPDDLRLALLAALGLHEDTTHPRLGERLEWLARRLARDSRTARRRADQACELLAELVDTLPDEPDEPGDGWYVRRFSALVRLDGQAPEVTETRTVVATQDGVGELGTEFSLPRHPADRRPTHDLGVAMLYGGRLVRRERRSESHFEFTVELPAELGIGQDHEYAMRLRVPAGQPVRPHYLFVPYRRCDLFELRLRFDPARTPRTLWRVTDSPLRVVDDGQPSGELLSPDAAGEIHQVYPEPRQGFAYGVQWNG